VEAELVRSREELSSQKAALERAWGEEKELKRMITDMTAEHGSLLNQIDGDKNLARGLEGIKQVRRTSMSGQEKVEYVWDGGRPMDEAVTLTLSVLGGGWTFV
jgi:hypothetical protein